MRLLRHLLLSPGRGSIAARTEEHCPSPDEGHEIPMALDGHRLYPPVGVQLAVCGSHLLAFSVTSVGCGRLRVERKTRAVGRSDVHAAHDRFKGLFARAELWPVTPMLSLLLLRGRSDRR